MFSSSNPVLNENTFSKPFGNMVDRNSIMTVDGTINKTAILLFFLVVGAIYPWYEISQNKSPASWMPLIIGGAIGSLVLSIIINIFPKTTPYLAPIYCLVKGAVIGAISAFYDKAFHGIVLQAVVLTFSVLFLMLFLYRTRIIRVTETFRTVVICATCAIGLFYLATWILYFFGINMPFINDNGIIGIGLSVVIVVVASLNLALSFDFIEQGANAAAPKYMEWFGAFGLIVTLVWLYIEILRLLSKLRSRD